MIGVIIDQISKGHIDSLVNAKVGEKRTFDYKEQLPGNSDEDKREFLYDVCSFANAVGGDLVFGVAEERDSGGKTTGLPASADGVPLPNAGDTIAKFENLVRDGISPRIQGIQWQSIDGFTGGSVLVMRIPKSFIGPHMVVFKNMARFYSRNNTGKYPMDFAEIRSAFIDSTDIGERLRAAVKARVNYIMGGSSPLGVLQKPTVVLHLIPTYSLVSNAFGDVIRRLAPVRPLLEPITSGANWAGRYNFDGYLTQASIPKSYVQLFSVRVD